MNNIKSNYFFSDVLFFLFVFLSITTFVKADERNILPRFPEIVIEKEFSQYFKVKDCSAKASIENDIAETKLKAVLANISEKDVSSSVKFRILYPTSLSKIEIKVNGKKYKYNQEQPNYAFSLKPNEEITFEMNTHVYINYSVDAVGKAIQKKEKEEAEARGVRKQKKSTKQKGKELSDSFLHLFKANDRYGKRFQIGPLVSKWGLFPVDFEKLSLEIKVPENYTIITDYENIWNDVTKSKKSLIFKTTDVDNYRDAIFLPESDKEEQLRTMRVLKSGILSK